MDIGRDNEKPVSWSYKSPFPFTGTIKTVVFDLEPTPKTVAERGDVEQAKHQTRVLEGIHG